MNSNEKKIKFKSLIQNFFNKFLLLVMLLQLLIKVNYDFYKN